VAAVDSVATDAINADFVCDGINDEVTIRQAFLSLVEDLGGGSYLYNGGKVVLLEGNYYCSDTIDLDFTGEPFSTIPPAWFTLEGMGFGTKLIFTPAPLASHGIDVITPTQIKGFILRDLRIFDPGNTGVHMDNGQVALIERVAVIGGQFGIDIENGWMTEITDCWVEGAADTCIRTDNPATIHGCAINLNADFTTTGYSERGIEVSGVESIVSNNRIFRSGIIQNEIGWSDIEIPTRAQINGPASSTVQAGIRVSSADRSVVEGNIIFQLPNHRPIDCASSGVNIIGNVIFNCDWVARNLPASSPAINCNGSECTVVGNFLSSLGQMGGILVTGDGIVSDNTLASISGHGIVLNGSSNVCSGNRLDAVATAGAGGDGITVSGTLNTVQGNYVLATRTTDVGSFGIAVTGSRCVISGNIVERTEREAIYVTGADNLVEGNSTSQIAATHIAVPAGAGTRNHIAHNKANFVAAGPGAVNAPRAFLTGVLTQVVVGNDATNGPWAVDATGYNLIVGTIDTFAGGAGPGDNF
jgi:hypothetical protein